MTGVVWRPVERGELLVFWDQGDDPGAPRIMRATEAIDLAAELRAYLEAHPEQSESFREDQFVGERLLDKVELLRWRSVEVDGYGRVVDAALVDMRTVYDRLSWANGKWRTDPGGQWCCWGPD